MKYDKDERDSAGQYAMAAAIDAQERNKENRNNFTAEQHLLADDLHVLVAAAFNSDTYKNCRKTEICVKAMKGTRNSAALTKLEKFCDDHGITGTRTKSGATIYTIKP